MLRTFGIRCLVAAFLVPGLIGLAEGGEVTYAEGFGSRHPERSDPMESTTLFRVASVS